MRSFLAGRRVEQRPSGLLDKDAAITARPGAAVLMDRSQSLSREIAQHSQPHEKPLAVLRGHARIGDASSIDRRDPRLRSHFVEQA